MSYRTKCVKSRRTKAGFQRRLCKTCNSSLTHKINNEAKELQMFLDWFDASSANNRLEGGINSRLREMLRNHRGLSIERRIKAVYWWCYMHSPKPLSLSLHRYDKSFND